MMMISIRTVYMISNENQRKSVVYVPGTRSVPNTRTGLYIAYTTYLHIALADDDDIDRTDDRC